MNAVCNLMILEKLETTGYKPPSNGQCERTNRTVCLGNALKEVVANVSTPKVVPPLLILPKHSLPKDTVLKHAEHQLC